MSTHAVVSASLRSGATGNAGRLRTPVLVVTLVHPDLLPPLHAFARCLVDEGFAPRVITFESPAGSSSPAPGVAIDVIGTHGGSRWARALARRRFARAVHEAVARDRPSLIVAACPASLLAATSAANATPVVYWAFEMYEARGRDFLRSPLTSLRNRRAFRAARHVALVCAPSKERAAWLVRRAGLPRTPAVVLNTPYLGGESGGRASGANALLPARFRDGRLVLHTGRVSRTQAVHELVRSLPQWPSDARLVITNVGDDAYARELREIVGSSPRAADVLLLPLVTRDQLRALQSLGTVGICLLRREGVLEAMMPAPNKVGEYLLAGMHVLAVRDAYFEPLAEAGVAELVESLDPVVIARGVTTLLGRNGEPGGRERPVGVARTWYNMRHQMAPMRALLARSTG